ncbi:MAG: helix-turn-helix domain-containing protein [Candidatus Beckwithbacteria bacterium]|nr:helix-turn-helix domain-containing protein [Candidatus Beckwithbacteria bacterium]
MQTAGSLLKSSRIKAKLTLTGVSHLTRIPLKTLLALEKNQFNALPPTPYIQGFIQNYAKIVHLNPDLAIAAFKRDFTHRRQKKLIPDGLIKPLNPSVNRRYFVWLFVGLIILAYLFLTIYKIFSPPQLILDQPQSGEEVKSPFLIKGKTNRDVTLTLNDRTVNLQPDGSFITTGTTSELNFKATSRRNKTTTLVRYVIIVQ